VFIFGCKTNKKMLNIGHRGAMGHETENTIASVKKALEMGVDMIEIDVFVLKSGEVVVFHDETLDSLTNAKGRIEDYTFEELKKVTVKGGHAIPTLQEIIVTINHKTPLNIELKGKNTALPTYKIVSEYLKKGWKKEDFVISSFLWNELTVYRNLDNAMYIAVLTEDNPLDAIPTAQALNAFAINAWYKTLTPANIKTIHKECFKVYAYTVNEIPNIQQMKKWGVDGVFCNYPERVK
jgi:glycerophosphoryl diester phosphodiesterase